MKKPQSRKLQNGLTTAEMVVYPMVVTVLVGVAFGFYHNSRIDSALTTAVDLGV